ncbi:3'-5' exonuclease [Robbsia andropogonis]|uniref:3'-5' exonuclease n=1 Tax=Robbsia andropogonis TaxID=28092 RepID=UPI002A6A9B62|nr:3'-5' exonuclease [Robbsia andropogonis]
MSVHFASTAEQSAVIDAALQGGDLKVKAYAGAGKTSTLELLASAMGERRCSYLAFNKTIAEHARHKFPAPVNCRTVHSLAFASVNGALTARLNLPEEAPHQLAARYKIQPIRVPSVTGRDLDLEQFDLGRMIIEGLGRFCRSADAVPLAEHIVVDEKVDERAAAWLRSNLVPHVVRLWQESVDPKGRSAIIPDVYLKVWAQSNPKINADVILFDEAQDSDGVMLSVLSRQKHAQTIYVGDPYQQIYEWRGAINAMAAIEAPERRLTQSFRFGSQIAILASEILRVLGEKTPVRGKENLGSFVVYDPSIRPPVDAVLCRKNVTAIWELASGVVAGKKPAIRMSAAEILAYADGADSLMAGKRAFRPAAFSLFETWKEAQDYSRSVAGRDTQPIVEFIDEYGTNGLRSLVPMITAEEKADYVISTVHRAKGLEWGRVKLMNDFRFRKEDGKTALDEDELRLLYVACTRAKHVLDITEIQNELAWALINGSK